MKKTDKIAYIAIIATIILLNIFIGSNIKDPIWIIQTIVSIITLIYIIVKKIQKEKQVIIKGKIDIAVLIFMISTTIPLIFKTYVSLEGTINFILKYWSVYGLYILTRNTIKEEKQIETIIKAVIISSIIPIIFGYDKLLNINIFEGFLDLINAVKITDTRMISIFGYANTFAVYLALTTSLSIGICIKESKRLYKILNLIYIIIGIITIMLTQSKAVLALIALAILIFLIKGIKEKKITKKVIIPIVIGIIVFFIYFFIAIQIPNVLEVTEEEKTCVIRGIEKNSEYNLEFDIEAISDKDYDSFKIVIVEITRYFSEKQIGIISLGDYVGKKSITVETDEIADHIEIRIVNSLNQTIKINEFKINDEPYILEYKYILDEIVRVFTTFNLKNTSVFQRFDYWSDGVDIIKDNWLLGAGGNAWRILYGQVQDYLYYAKESHNYILEIFMSFGIIGILAYIVIIAITIQNGSNQLKNKTIASILVGIAFIILHSMMDFDMSYLIIEMIVFMFIAIINKEDEQIELKSNCLEYIITMFFLVVAILNSLAVITTLSEDENGTPKINLTNWIYEYQYNEIKKVEDYNVQTEENIERIKDFIEKEPYICQNEMYQILGNTIIETLTDENIDIKIEQLDYLINTLKTVKMDRTYDVEEIEDRADILLELYENIKEKADKLDNKELEEKGKEFLQIIVDEYPEKSQIIQDYEKNQIGKVIANMKYENYTALYNKVKELLEEVE